MSVCRSFFPALLTVAGLAHAARGEGGGPPRPIVPRPVVVEYAASDTSFAGVYRVEGDPVATVTMRPLARGQAYLAGSGWEALGWFDRAAFDGAWRRPGADAGSEVGLLHVERGPAGAMVATFTGADGTVTRRERWLPPARAGAADDVPQRMPVVLERPGPEPDSLPRFGGYVHVEQLPAAVLEVPPTYPDLARETGIEGTVLVQALVGRDGWVKDTRVTAPVAGLNDAAVECVRRWQFKPALDKGRPVAVWIAIPVKFSLH